MALLQATNLRHAYGADVILRGANLTIQAGQRVGLVGPNGSGKSTLFRALTATLPIDAGEVSLARGRRLGYLTQKPTLDDNETVWQAAEDAFAELHALHGELDGVFAAMAAPGLATETLETLLQQQADLEERVEAAGGYAIEHKVEAALHGLGFTDSQFKLTCGKLSGGQRARLALAKLLLERPDILLLDEPTNHLDINGRLWLEGFLRDEYQGAVCMITHDRRMLDNVAQKIFELEAGRLIEYPGNYTAFRRLRRERRVTQMRAYEKEQTRFKTQEAYIRKYKTGQRAKEARGRQSKLDREKQDAIQKPLELDTFRFELPKAPMPSNTLIAARSFSKAYAVPGSPAGGAGEHGKEDGRGGKDAAKKPAKVLFDALDVTINRGERWGIVGPNGAGKTTLVKCMLGELGVDAGTVKQGNNLAIGYFQQVVELTHPEIPVYRYIQKLVQIEDQSIDISEQKARDLAGAFLFSGDDQDKPIGVMSGGEQGRARLAALLASAKNLLVLDEPTNHLDIQSAERLEEALAADGGYAGAMILISHDRALLDAACDHLIVLDGDGGAEVFLGAYSEWRDRGKRRDAAAREAEEARAADAAKRDRVRQKAEEDRQAAQERKAGGNNKRGKKKNNANTLSRMPTAKLEAEIERAETAIAAIDARLAHPDVWGSPDAAEKIGAERAALAAELEPYEFEWSRRAEEEAAG